jgi:EmrB/QacA subfamily drug resistance transporter
MAQPFVEPCASGIIRAAARAPAADMPPARRRMLLAACVLASAMVFIDGSALTVALPKLRAYFGADLASVQWVLNGYVLALASLTLVGGALADVYGKARVLAISCVAFGIASAACAVAPSVPWLIFARVVQGIAAAILTPTSLSFIGAIYPDDQRSRAIGVWASASALTTAGGPVLGGWLTESAGWQWVFAINPPLALVAVGLILAYAPADRPQPRRFDFVGAAILAFGLGALAWALSQIGPSDCAAAAPCWMRHASVAVSAVAAAALIGYAVWERRTDHPMTPPRLVANNVFVSLNVATLLVYAGIAIMFFLLSFDLLDRRHLSPTDAGLAFLPFTLGVGLLSRVFGAVADKLGPRPMLIAGSAGAALAYVAMALGATASLLFGVIAPMALLGVSFAVLVAPLTAAVLSSLPAADEGLASGVNNAVSRIAQLAGIALAAGVAPYSFGYEIGLAAAALASIAAALVVAAKMPPGPPAQASNDPAGHQKRRWPGQARP